MERLVRSPRRFQTEPGGDCGDGAPARVEPSLRPLTPESYTALWDICFMLIYMLESAHHVGGVDNEKSGVASTRTAVK
jgi:hypothetical protein